MPVILNIPIMGSDADPELKYGDFREVDIAYQYPLGLDLKPGTVLHDKIVKAVLLKAFMSHTAMTSRYSSWRQIDRTLTAYINTDWKTQAQTDRTKVEPIVIPVTYGALETLMTYMVAAFFDYPIFSYEGVGPEDMIGATLLEKCIESDCRRNKVALALYTMMRSAFAYGIGPASPQWAVERLPQYLGGDFGNIVVGENILEGNRLATVDPYQYLPDPDCPIHDVQSGEFAGWTTRTNLMSLLGEEESNPTRLFNCRYLQYMRGAGTSVIYTNAQSQSGRDEMSGMSRGVYGTGASKFIDVINLYMNIIPASWGLGKEEYPRKWLFRVAADKVLIGAMPLGLNHNKFPLVVTAPTFDGFSISPISMLESTYGIQETVDWLITAHVANIKKYINDSLVVDPYLVNINDVKKPGPGRIIRKRRAAWGKGDVMDGIGQLQVKDVTQSHLTDIGMLMDMMKQSIGTGDIVQGIIQRRGERVSAQEAGGAMRSALSRLEMIARLISMQGMQDVATMFAYHSQQLMSQETYVKNVGEWEQMLLADYGMAAGRVLVRPQDINVAFDVMPKDGTIPKGEGIDAWVNMYKVIAGNPLLMQEFDMVRIFKHMARMLGAKDIDKFGVRVVPNEQAMRMAESGQIAPVQEVINE